MKIRRVVAGMMLGILAVFLDASTAGADTSLSVTVTPPLFQLSISPGESWSSSLKVVNANPYDVTYYAEPMDFVAEGEGGQAAMSPASDSKDPSKKTFSLAQWIEISPDPVVIKKGSSGQIPFAIHVPADAEPGGHYAAILVGTRPPQANIAGASVKVSSYVSSLLFLRVEGKITENGRIREFQTERNLYQSAGASFLLRFENLGNTHLKPMGVITIYNMWGKKRGEVLINQKSNFGNVLPKSIRKFEFSWEGDSSLFDIGQYSAVATLSYGDENKQTTSATTYFWVVPVVPVASTLVSILAFGLLLTWFIRRYIRRALSLERQKHLSAEPISTAPLSRHQDAYSLSTMIEPIREGVIDLRRVSLGTGKQVEMSVPRASGGSESEGSNGKDISLRQFLRTYRMFFLFVAVIIIGSVAAYTYFQKVLARERAFQIHNVSTQQEVRVTP